MIKYKVTLEQFSKKDDNPSACEPEHEAIFDTLSDAQKCYDEIDIEYHYHIMNEADKANYYYTKWLFKCVCNSDDNCYDVDEIIACDECREN